MLARTLGALQKSLKHCSAASQICNPPERLQSLSTDLQFYLSM